MIELGRIDIWNASLKQSLVLYGLGLQRQELAFMGQDVWTTSCKTMNATPRKQRHRHEGAILSPAPSGQGLSIHHFALTCRYP